MTRHYLTAYDDSMNELKHPYSPIEVYVWPDKTIRTEPYEIVDNVENWNEGEHAND